MKLPNSFFILNISPCKEADFVKWKQTLKKYDLDVKFIKPTSLLGIYTKIYNYNLPNLFQVSCVLVYAQPDTLTSLFISYRQFLEREVTLTLNQTNKVKILVTMNEGKFYHAGCFTTIKNQQRERVVKSVILTWYKPLLIILKTCNLPFYKLVWLLSRVLQQQK